MIRKLLETEAELIRRIDRTETITSSYRLREGKLEKYQHELIQAAWDPHELSNIIHRTERMIADNGVVIGYFKKAELVGVASLDIEPLNDRDHFYQLDILHVSNSFRAQGVGMKLFNKIKHHAEQLGAAGIYISATPTANTVNFYLHHGCQLTRPNPKLFEKEPDDIHLALVL